MIIARSVDAARALSLLILMCCASANAAVYFSGTVVDTQNQPLAGATVVAGHADPSFVNPFAIDGQTTTNAQGQFAITTLDAGDGSGLYILAAQLAGYVTVIYPNLPCPGQGCLDYSPPNLAVAPPITNANLQLTHAATVSGHVSRTDTNSPVNSGRIEVFGTNRIAIVDPDVDGNFSVSDLLPGNYQAWTEAVSLGTPGLLDQIYAGHDYDETYPLGTTTTLGDVFTLSEGQVLTGIDFGLNTGAVLSGAISSALDGAPLGAQVSLHRVQPVDPGYYVQVATSAAFGVQTPDLYTSSPLAPGTFYIQVSENDDFQPWFYPGVATEAQAQLVVLSLGQQLVLDVQLTPARTIAGTVTDAATGLPMKGASVHAAAAFCVFFCVPFDVAITTSDDSGIYLLQGLDSSTAFDPHTTGYYIWAESTGYICQFYASANPCSFDSVQGEIPALALGAAEQKTGINLVLNKGTFATGRVYDPLTGGAISGYQVQFFDSAGNPVGGLNGLGQYDGQLSDAAGYYATGAVAPGSYYLVILTPSYSSIFLYPNVPCAAYYSCDFSQGQLVDMSTAQEYPNLDFAIPNLDLIFRGNFE